MSLRGRLQQMGASMVLLLVLVVVFAFQCINDVYLRSVVEERLALTSAWLLQGWLWQLLTFQFLHLSLWHLICNGLALWFFGRFVEHAIGWRRFLLAYFGCGVVGGLLQGTLMVLFPRHFAPFVFGASAGVSGIFAIFVRLLPEAEVRLNFILPVRAELLLWVTAGISLFFTVVPSARGGDLAHAAHLGGILAGLTFVRLGWHRDFVPLPGAGLLARWKRRRAAARPARTLVRHRGESGTGWTRASLEDDSDASATDFISREVDPILDKISQHGIHSLTPRERQILERARAKMEQRTRDR
jgi:membrane associated rhomboid family serine protease